MTFMLATVMLIRAQLRVLNSKMKSISSENIVNVKVPDKSVAKRIRHTHPFDVVKVVDERTGVKVTPARTGEPVMNEDTLKFFGEDERSAIDVVSLMRQHSLEKLKKREKEITMEIKLVECVQLHQALFRSAKS